MTLIERAAVTEGEYLDLERRSATKHELIHLWPRLAPGGICIIDDYGAIPACKQAVHDFRFRSKN